MAIAEPAHTVADDDEPFTLFDAASTPDARTWPNPIRTSRAVSSACPEGTVTGTRRAFPPTPDWRRDLLRVRLRIDAGTCHLPGHAWGDAWLLPVNGHDHYACNCFRPDHGRKQVTAHRPCDYWALGDAYRALWTEARLEPLVPAKLEAMRGPDRPTRGMRLAWWLLLEHDAGLRDPVPCPLPVPDAASDLQRRTAELAALMFGLRLADDRDLEMPLSTTLVAERLRVARQRAQEALRALVGYGTLRQTGETQRQGRHRHGAFLYVPGRGEAVPIRRTAHDND